MRPILSAGEQQLVTEKLLQTITSKNLEYAPRSELKAISRVARCLLSAPEGMTKDDLTEISIIWCNTVQGYWARKECLA